MKVNNKPNNEPNNNEHNKNEPNLNVVPVNFSKLEEVN